MKDRKCVYCLKCFTKKGIRNHRDRCKEKCEKSLICVKNATSNIFTQLPDDIIFYIYEFFYCNPMTKYYTIARVVKELSPISKTCKSMYEYFSPLKFRLLYEKEKKEKLEEQYVKKKYKLTNEELKSLSVKHAKEYGILYWKTDIMNLCFEKYGHGKEMVYRKRIMK